MLIGLFIIFAILITLSLVEDYLDEKTKWFAYLIMGIILIMYSALRPVGFDRDSPKYEIIFMRPDSKESVFSVEPFFLWICHTCFLIMQNVRIILVLFAVMGVTIKLYAIKRLTPMFFLPLVIYFGNFFFLHENTQIRAGIASGLFLIAIPSLAEGKKMRTFCFIVLACLFHYSALALFPFLFIGNKPMGKYKKLAFASIVPIGFVMYVLNLDLITTIPIPFITDKVEAYKAASEFGLHDKNTILNPFLLIKMAVFLYFLYFSDTIEKYVPSIHLLTKILGWSIMAYIALSSVAIISSRISEFYGIIEIVAYPCIAYTIRPKIIGKLIVCLIALIEIFFNTMVWDFFDFNV